jgi:hypothetical protein
MAEGLSGEKGGGAAPECGGATVMPPELAPMRYGARYYAFLAQNRSGGPR